MKYKSKNIFGKLYSSSHYKEGILLSLKKDRVLRCEKFAFTLIELLVGVSISVMLMVSVSMFVSGGMKNILDEQRIIENSGNFNNFASNLQSTFNYTGSGEFIQTIGGSGVLFKRGQFFDKGGFSYIGETSMDKFYCMSGSESETTNHAIIKTFVPFEENGENMFIVGDYDKIFTGSSDISNTYISYALDDVIKDSFGKVIIGKFIDGESIYGDKFNDGDFGTGIYLNNPTGLALSGSNILFISDTLNNRVLYYNITTKKIYKLLDELDGILEPTGLLYKDNKLYISNSGRGEILEYSSPVIVSNPTLTMSGFSVNNINNFEIEVFTGVTLTGPYSTGAYNFTGLSSFEDFARGSTNKLKYYFSDYMNQVSTTGDINMGVCNPSISYYLNGNTPNKKIITCSSSNTGSTVIKDGNKLVNFINSNEISISGISPNFTSTGTYYVDLKLFNGTILKYHKYFPYFTQGDDDILTPGDNTLKVFKSGLKYPTGLWWAGNLQYNEFNKVGRSYDFQYTSYNKNSDYILKTPMKSLSVNKTGNLFTLFMKYYKNYNCYNLDEFALRSYVLKKKF